MSMKYALKNGVITPVSEAVDINGNLKFNKPEGFFVVYVIGCNIITILILASTKKFTVDH